MLSLNIAMVIFNNCYSVKKIFYLWIDNALECTQIDMSLEPSNQFETDWKSMNRTKAASICLARLLWDLNSAHQYDFMLQRPWKAVLRLDTSCIR